MSFFGTITKVGGALAGVGAVFGGGGTTTGNVNLARNFSARCGISPPVLSSVATQAMNQFPGDFASQCTFARTGAPPLPQIPLPPPPRGGAMDFLIPPAAAATVGRVGTIAGIIRGASGKILRVALPTGQTVSRKNAVAMARRVGIELAAATLGITAFEMAQMILDEQTTRRRRRGITDRDLRNARRVACRVSRMARDLNVKPATRSRSPCR